MTTDQAGPVAAAAATAATPLTRALETIRSLRAQLAAQQDRVAIAVVGMGLRLPGGIADTEAYWTALAAGRDLTGPLPDARYVPFADRWRTVPSRAAYLDEALAFDAGFFGLGADEARGLDPQQRLLLEVAWEALDDAALPVDRIDGARTGAFIGVLNQEYWDWLRAQPDLHWAGGNGHCFAVGRLAYHLGLAGPAITVDTACSSSLVAVHLARQALARKECDIALAGGVNLVLSPRGSELHHLAGMLAPDGRCKAFDARADGFTRSEGCGLVVLKRLDDAVADGDRIHAVLAGSAVNQAGRSTGFAAPNVLSEVTLIESALADAGLGPADIGMVEAHGTGTSLGDTIEMEALAAALGRKNGGQPLPVGSVKTNMGHLESAAGIAALLKAILCVRHRAVPPLLHFTTLNPLIDLSGTGITLPTELTTWPSGAGRYASVSAYGMGGTNAHVVVGQADAPTADPGPAQVPVTGFELSAKSPEAVGELAERYFQRLATLPGDVYPAFAYTVTQGRARHYWRAQVTAADQAAALAALRALADGEQSNSVALRQVDPWADHGQPGQAGLPRRVLDLPSYPWHRQHYLPEQPDAPTAKDRPAAPEEPTSSAAPSESTEHGDDDAAILATVSEIRAKLMSVEPGRRRLSLLAGHCLDVAASVLKVGRSEIDPAAPIASLGFDSVKTLRMHALLEDSLQVELPVTVAWQYPTLAALVPFIAERMGLNGDEDLSREVKAAVGPPTSASADPADDSSIEDLLLARLDQIDELDRIDEGRTR